MNLKKGAATLSLASLAAMLGLSQVSAFSGAGPTVQNLSESVKAEVIHVKTQKTKIKDTTVIKEKTKSNKHGTTTTTSTTTTITEHQPATGR